MKIGLRILLGYFLVVGLAAWFVLNVFVAEVKPGVRGTLEDTLVDTANLLATLISSDLSQDRLQDSRLGHSLQNLNQSQVLARIGGITKRSLDYRIYVTDDKGIVVFDSSGADVGKDFSRWNDVYLTLRGQYGVRSSRSIPDDETTSVMHVAAPIKQGDKIVGVLTVAKPIATVQPFIVRSQRIIIKRGGTLLGLSLLIGLAFASWLTYSLRKLQTYAKQVESGQKVSLPKLGRNEIGDLANALESMRDKLEGKEYAEELMHTLAHELKSPIAAIRSAAELLREPMTQEERNNFVSAILEQNTRQQQLIEKLLALITVEKQQQLLHATRLSLLDLVTQVCSDFQHQIDAGHLSLHVDVAPLEMLADSLLMRQALGNLLSNAIDFSEPGSLIEIRSSTEGSFIVLSIRDHGTGIPDFAIDKIYDRFYSLPRPDGQRSTGLGLPFVREVVNLHRGQITLCNAVGGGTLVTLRFPNQS